MPSLPWPSINLRGAWLGFSGDCYAEDDREEIKAKLRRASPSDHATSEQLDAAICQIDDLATEYLLRKECIPERPTPTELRRQLDRLCRSVRKDRFIKAAADLHPSLWIDIALHLKASDPAYRRISRAEKLNVSELLPYDRKVRRAASCALTTLRNKRRKTGDRKNIYVAWFAWTLLPIYEQFSGKKLSPYSLRKSQPFLEFLEACLKPIDPAAVEVRSLLGQRVFRHIGRSKYLKNNK